MQPPYLDPCSDWYELGANPFMQDDTSPKKFRREKPKAKKGKGKASSLSFYTDLPI